MSTLGDLLAEHTMLPGNAVDHLHALVGEWQLLADLSFADYLMWVRRDDGVLAAREPGDPGDAKHAEWVAEMERVHQTAELIVAKQRHGATGKVRLKFEPKITRFSDLAQESFIAD